MKFAPIVLFIYNRPWHTEQTLIALANNDLAQESILYIFADGPKPEISTEEFAKISKTRAIAKQQKWCKDVVIFEQKENKGLAESIIDGVTEIVNKHGKVIVLEDDLITGKGFLTYMNEGLRKYESKTQVISINAYCFPFNSKRLPNTFFLKGADCWGWATWKRGWDLFNKNEKQLYHQIINNNHTYEFDLDGSIDYTAMLKNQVDGKINSWAIRWYASAFLKNKLTLYPKQSLVKNIGLDGSGTNCVTNKQLSKNYQNYCKLNSIQLTENKLARKKIKQYHKPNFFKRLLNNSVWF